MTDTPTNIERSDIELRIIREVSIQAETMYLDAVALGEHAAHAISKAHRSQMTGLENIAESTLKITDVFDYVKRQVARYSYWRQNHPGHSDEPFGLRLRNYLEDDLAKRRKHVCDELNIGEATDDDRQLRRRVYILLIQQFIRHMVVHYEFKVNIEDYQQQAGHRR